jgi:tetratricopeptide (TPR) repeat protein
MVHPLGADQVQLTANYYNHVFVPLGKVTPMMSAKNLAKFQAYLGGFTGMQADAAKLVPLLAQALMASGDVPNGAREYVRAAELLPDNVDAHLNAARYLLAGREFDQARTHAERVIQKDPKNVEGHILLGSAIAGLKDLPGAMKEVEEAIELAPTSSLGYTNKAALLLAQGRKQDALANFRRRSRSTVGRRVPRAGQLSLDGRSDRGRKAMKDALAPSRPTRHPRAGPVHMSAGRAAEPSPTSRRGDGSGNA